MTIRPRFLAACFALASLSIAAQAQTSPPAMQSPAPIVPTPMQPVTPAPPPPVAPTTPAPPVSPIAPTDPSTPVAPPPVAAPPRAPAVVDPAARELITQMITAHKALHSFIVTIDAQDTSDGTLVPASMLRTRVTFQAPAKAAVTLTRGGKMVGQFFSNGTYFIAVNPPQKKYAKNPLPAAIVAQVVAGQIGQVGLMGQLLVNPDGLNGLLTAPTLSTITKSPDVLTVSGVTVDTVVANLTDPSGRAATFTFAIGQTDHIIRRVIIQQETSAAVGTAAKPVSHTETVFALKPNPVLPVSTFAYTPPKGYQKVAH